MEEKSSRSIEDDLALLESLTWDDTCHMEATRQHLEGCQHNRFSESSDSEDEGCESEGATKVIDELANEIEQSSRLKKNSDSSTLFNVGDMLNVSLISASGDASIEITRDMIMNWDQHCVPSELIVDDECKS